MLVVEVGFFYTVLGLLVDIIASPELKPTGSLGILEQKMPVQLI